MQDKGLPEDDMALLPALPRGVRVIVFRLLHEPAFGTVTFFGDKRKVAPHQRVHAAAGGCACGNEAGPSAALLAPCPGCVLSRSADARLRRRMGSFGASCSSAARSDPRPPVPAGSPRVQPPAPAPSPAPPLACGTPRRGLVHEHDSHLQRKRLLLRIE